MPKYGLPGVAIHERGSRIFGSAAIAVVLVAGAAWVGYNHFKTDEAFRLTLHTEQVGAGVVSGSEVRLDGVKIGAVDSVTSAGEGTQMISLALERDQIPGLLTDDLAITYAPGNLFGISQIDIDATSQGEPVVEGQTVDLTGTRADRATDATMGALLESVTRTTTQVLTPQFSDVLSQLARDTRAYAPMLQAVVELTKTVTDTQRYDPTYLLAQYASAVEGVPPFMEKTVDVFTVLNEHPKLVNRLPEINQVIDVVVLDLMPAVVHVAETAGTYFSGYADMTAPLLWGIAGTVDDPQRSSAELRELILRLDGAYRPGPNGPVLNVDVQVGEGGR